MSDALAGLRRHYGDELLVRRDNRLHLTPLAEALRERVAEALTGAGYAFGVAALVSAASHTCPLLAGDLLLTGSPAGNGTHHGRLLRAGDVRESTITGLAIQRTACVAPPSR